MRGWRNHNLGTTEEVGHPRAGLTRQQFNRFGNPQFLHPLLRLGLPLHRRAEKERPRISLQHPRNGLKERIVTHVSAHAARVDDQIRVAFLIRRRVKEVKLNPPAPREHNRRPGRVESPLTGEKIIAAAIGMQGVGALHGQAGKARHPPRGAGVQRKIVAPNRNKQRR